MALPQQSEEIGSICALARTADISSHLSDFGDVCREIKRAPRSPCSAEADQRFALALVPLTPLSCLGYMHSARKADSECATFVHCFIVQELKTRKRVLRYVAIGVKSASKLRID